METTLIPRFAPILLNLTEAELAGEIEKPCQLLIERSSHGRKSVETVYAPFDHVNHGAALVLVGITPGRQQMRNALFEARRQLQRGRSHHEALEAAKVFASFSGPMRANLVALLDGIGVNSVLGLSTTASLWNGDARRAPFANYNGARLKLPPEPVLT